MANNSKEAVERQIIQARISMLLQQPFWGTLAIRLRLKDVTDEGWCPTAATDGRCLYYNRDFMAKLDKQETIFVVAHECQHSIYDHMDRRGSRNPKAWNAAADYVINYELYEHNIGKLPDPVRSGVQACFDQKFKGMFTEEVYEKLMEDPNRQYPEFDVHMEPGDGNGEEMSEEEQRELQIEIRNAVMQAAKTSPGNVPNGVKRLLKDLNEPQMDWREVLNMQLQSTLKSDYTWERCSRKVQSMGIYLPAMKEDFRVEAAIAIDCSGSMSDEMLRDLLSEVKGIMLQFTDFKLDVWCFDTAVYAHKLFTPDTLDDIDHYEIHGGGGTNFMCNYDYMKDNDIKPQKFLMFTDGYGEGWGDPLYTDSIFIIHGDPGHRIVAEHGMTVWYEAK